ncbi:protein-serine O-palmitoleoyltransferase porcupine [Chrysoperla carnea]|uniref:protein-serine O-palmitoleoyltransferase porcupine n=1 Tax=Chrysoperla carnea TaxID=189513 RepID=UPI001D07C5D1|nr:protein-serine O-palmitoleoyltransferase porcupine [Chrysoperla carnea]
MDNFDENLYVYETDPDMEYYDEDPNINHLIEHQSFLSSLNNCAFPVLEKTLVSVIGFLVWALIYRLSHYVLPNRWTHVVSCICGFGTLYKNNIATFTHVIYLGISTYVFLIILVHYLNSKYKGYSMALYCFSYLLLCEFLVESQVWRQISSIQMIMVMKTVSIAFDVEKQVINMPPFLHYFGYIYSVSNILFGPWMSFQEYTKINVSLNFTSFITTVKHVFISLSCLLVSNCFGYWLIPDDCNDWLLVYRDAFLFRTSHYFISHLSKAISITSGYHYTDVVHITAIEFPKSLSQVVVHWNIPMHRWLKHYVFRPSQHIGKFVAVLNVYLASSALHGFSAALALVLLSLGFYTYIEYMLRSKISAALNSCTLVTSCKENCGHAYTKRSTLTILVNLFFTGLAILHLAYLGVIFEDISLMRATNPLTHTISTWADVGFISHIIIGIQCV